MGLCFFDYGIYNKLISQNSNQFIGLGNSDYEIMKGNTQIFLALDVVL